MSRIIDHKCPSSKFNFLYKKLKILFSGVKDNYPKVEYSEAEILHDTKNILDQNFVEKYCKLMQVSVTVRLA
jgi:hypothetical protein